MPMAQGMHSFAAGGAVLSSTASGFVLRGVTPIYRSHASASLATDRCNGGSPRFESPRGEACAVLPAPQRRRDRHSRPATCEREVRRDATAAHIAR